MVMWFWVRCRMRLGLRNDTSGHNLICASYYNERHIGNEMRLAYPTDRHLLCTLDKIHINLKHLS